ncbi:SPAC6G9.01c, partial [Cucurbita argyrosperma subsp. argyrosperma]
MPKKKSSKAPKEVKEKVITKEEKSSNAVGKNEKPNSSIKEGKPPSVKKRSEIDEIFAGKKRKKPEVQEAKKPKQDALDRPMKLKNKKRDETQPRNDFVDPPSQGRKKTGDGLKIYTEEELGIGSADAGGTPLCPFDCSCCF